MKATPEMIAAGAEAARRYMEETGGNSPAVIWDAMWAARPPLPVQEPYGYWWIPDGSVSGLKPEMSPNTGPHPNFTVIPLYTAPLAAAPVQPVAFYVYEWINPSDGVVFRSFRADEYQCGRGPDRTVAVPSPPAAAQPAVPLTTMQPLVDVNGVMRFKANAIVSHLLQTHPTCDMNKLASMDFTDEDRMQFAQLIGYSVGGYADLSYVSDESYEAAEKAARQITAAPEKGM
jgi:hypothetical protein